MIKRFLVLTIMISTIYGPSASGSMWDNGYLGMAKRAYEGATKTRGQQDSEADEKIKKEKAEATAANDKERLARAEQAEKERGSVKSEIASQYQGWTNMMAGSSRGY